jgi:hypothetical protein
MNRNNSDAGRPAFYTVPEAARILCVDPATLYRAIREDAFPAVRVRSRYVCRRWRWSGWRPRPPKPAAGLTWLGWRQSGGRLATSLGSPAVRRGDR